MLLDACSKPSLASKFSGKFSDFAYFWSQNPRNLAPRHLKIIPKSKPMAVPKQSSYQGRPKVIILSKSNGFLTSKWNPQINKIRFENEVEKQQPWEPKLNGFQTNFGVENRPKNVPVRGKWISWKTLFLLCKIKVFQLWGPPEIIKFAARNEDVKQTAPKLEISMIFGAFWPLKSTRKATRNGRRYGRHPGLGGS